MQFTDVMVSPHSLALVLVGDWWWMNDQVVDWHGTQWLITTLVGKEE